VWLAGDTAGEGDVEGAEGLFPALGEGAFDEAGLGGALVGGFAFFGFAGAGAFVFDVADDQPDQLDDRVVGREVAAVLDDSADLVVQRFDRVRTRYERARRPACCSASPACRSGGGVLMLGIRCDRPEQGPSGNTFGQAVLAQWAASPC
jgi:hypothetical protein